MDNLMLRRRLMMAAQGVWTTVTATTPFSVQNALKAKVKSLIQYGKMVQDGTPTPDAPVYPVINGGVVQMVDDELPAGYKRLLGITFDGNFHYRTGEYLTSDDVVTMTLDNLSTSGKNVFGSYNGANGKNFSLYIYGSSTSGSYFRFGDVLKRPVYGGTGRRTITFGAGGTSGFADDVSIAPDEFTTPANTYIGMLPNSTSAAYTGDIVGNILVGTRLKWIPCESDGGVIGYYERVNGNFIAPTGGGTPVSLGYDNSHLVPRVVGTPEVLTVGKNLFSQDSYLDAYCSAGGTITAHNSSRCFVMECKPNTEYLFIFDNSAIDSPRCVINGFAAQPEIGMRSKQVCYSSSNTSAMLHDTTFTTNADVHYLVMWLMYQKSDADTKAAVNNAVLVETATAQTATVINLFAVGDYADEVDVVSGGVTRRVLCVALTSDLPWFAVTGRTGLYGVPVADGVLTENKLAASSHYVGTVASNDSMADNTIKTTHASVLAPGKVSVYIKDTTHGTSLDTFKAWLDEAGVIAIVPLATPTTESITPQELSTVKGNNVIDATSDIAPFDVSVTYRARK